MNNTFTDLTKEQIGKDPAQQLKNFKRTKNLLITIDNDGCVADNMNGKQMLVFHPQFMEFYGLWEIESYFREAAEYYNLFSVHRGCNRFIALQYMLKSLAARKDVQAVVKEKGIKLPGTESLDEYLEYCKKNNLGQGNLTLRKFLDTRPYDLSIYKLLGWSDAVNDTFPYMNDKIPPFPNVRESLELISKYADIVVVAQASYYDLLDYWSVQDIKKYLRTIAGQEMGTKAQNIETVKKAGGYRDDQVLMLGDAEGDLKAVKKNNGFFYPIMPGSEKKSWQEFGKYFNAFVEGKYKSFEEKLLKKFGAILLSEPAWDKPGYDHVKAYKEKQEIRKAVYEALIPEGRLLVF
ncbi:MAG: hypothetical protein V1752_05940 [Candidatus Firestonebacteria bacterium]